MYAPFASLNRLRVGRTCAQGSFPNRDNSPAIRVFDGLPWVLFDCRIALCFAATLRPTRGSPPLTVEGLRNRSRATYLAEKQDFHLKIAPSLVTATVSNPDFRAQPWTSAVGLNPTEVSQVVPNDRVLKKSGGQSHLSILTVTIDLFATGAGFQLHDRNHVHGISFRRQQLRNVPGLDPVIL